MDIKETLDAIVSYDGSGRRLNQYIIKKKIGSGSFGVVHLAHDNSSNRDVAVKECSKSKLKRQKQQADFSARGGRGRGRATISRRITVSRPAQKATTNPIDLVRGEIAILKKLKHKNVVQLFEVLDDPTQDSLFMVFELCENGNVIDLNLDTVVKPLPDELARDYFQQLLLGIEYLHEHEIVHRGSFYLIDIKPENMLIAKDGTLKIVDFGVSEMFTKGKNLNKTAGSPTFYAPETCGCLPAMAGDVWAMGVTLFGMAFGYLPFTGKTLLDLFASIREDTQQYPKDADPRLAAVLDKLLKKNPDERITIEELREDAWVTDDMKKPLIPFEENCQIADIVITQSDLDAAVQKVFSLFVVLKAVWKFKALLKKRKINRANV